MVVMLELAVLSIFMNHLETSGLHFHEQHVGCLYFPVTEDKAKKKNNNKA